MNNIAQELETTLKYLSQMRQGYRYSINLSVKEHKWTVSVTGECYEDNSKPTDFLVVQTENFAEIPALVKLKAQDIINKAIEANQARVSHLLKANEVLQGQVELLKAFQTP